MGRFLEILGDVEIADDATRQVSETASIGASSNTLKATLTLSFKTNPEVVTR